MDLPSQQHPLSHVVHQPANLSLRLDAAGASLPPDEPPVSFKTYFNTLYPSPTMPTTALRSENLVCSCFK